jgi:hypothetical protein
MYLHLSYLEAWGRRSSWGQEFEASLNNKMGQNKIKLLKWAFPPKAISSQGSKKKIAAKKQTIKTNKQTTNTNQNKENYKQEEMNYKTLTCSLQQFPNFWSCKIPVTVTHLDLEDTAPAELHAPLFRLNVTTRKSCYSIYIYVYEENYNKTSQIRFHGIHFFCFVFILWDRVSIYSPQWL